MGGGGVEIAYLGNVTFISSIEISFFFCAKMVPYHFKMMLKKLQGADSKNIYIQGRNFALLGGAAAPPKEVFAPPKLWLAPPKAGGRSGGDEAVRRLTQKYCYEIIC